MGVGLSHSVATASCYSETKFHCSKMAADSAEALAEAVWGSLPQEVAALFICHQNLPQMLEQVWQCQGREGEN